MLRVRRARLNGLSLLLEVMIGFGLFSTCLLMIFGIFPTSARSLALARDHTQATAMARQYIDQYGAYQFNELKGLTIPGPFTVVRNTVVNGVVTEQDYQVTITRAQPFPACFDVKVKVTWWEGTQGGIGSWQHEVDMETYVTTH